MGETKLRRTLATASSHDTVLMVSIVLAASYNGCILYTTWICLFSPQNLSRSEPITSGGTAARAAQAKKEKKKRMPKLEEFLQSRDYVGAMTLLDVSYYLFP